MIHLKRFAVGLAFLLFFFGFLFAVGYGIAKSGLSGGQIAGGMICLFLLVGAYGIGKDVFP